MSYFPMCVDLTGKRILLVGGGPQIQEKAEKLRPFGAKLRFADTLTAAMLEERPAFAVIGDVSREQAGSYSRLCGEFCIPVNVVDRPELCSFFFPALITEGDLTVSVSTGGKSPGAAAYLRQQIQACIPERTGEILDWLGTLRQELKKICPDGDHRRTLKEVTIQAFEKNRPLTEAEWRRLLGRK